MQRAQPVHLPELPLQYADYAVWQRGWLQGAELAATAGLLARRRWLIALTLLELPTDHPRPAEQSYAGASLVRQLPRGTAGRPAAVFESPRKARSTWCCSPLSMCLLGRWAATDTVVVGTPIAGRRHSELEGMIGFLSNTLALPADLGR